MKFRILYDKDLDICCTVNIYTQFILYSIHIVVYLVQVLFVHEDDRC